MDLSASENAEIDESCDSSSDVTKLDFPDGINYDSHAESGSESQIDFGERTYYVVTFNKYIYIYLVLKREGLLTHREQIKFNGFF